MARAFNGGQSLSSPYDARLEPPTAPLAISLRCKASASPGNFKYLMSKVCNPSDHASYAIATEGTGGVRFSIGYGTNAGQFTNSPVIPNASIWNGQWHHVIGYFDGSALFIFFDGAQQGTFSSTPNGNIAYDASPVGVNLGSFDTTSLYFAGELAEAAIWTMVPTAADIAALAAGFSPMMVRPDKLLAYWPLLGYGLPEIEPLKGLDMSLSHGAALSATAHPRTFRRTRSLAVPPPSAAAPPPSAAGINDSITLADSVSRSLARQRDLAESVSLTDSAAVAALTSVRAIDETVILADQPSRTLVVARSLDEAITFADEATTSASAARFVAESVTLAAAVAGTREMARSTAEGLMFADSAQVGFVPAGPTKAAPHYISISSKPATVTPSVPQSSVRRTV